MLVVAASLGGSALEAQTTASANASITIPTLLSIDVDALAVTFDQPDFADYDAGFVQSVVTSVIDTRGNVVHDVTIEADAATMSYSAGPGPDPLKPASDLQWDAGSGWSGLTTTAVDVVAGLARGVNAGAASVTYRILLDEAADIPGTYSLDFTYTVVAN